ncbi:hypothetical protein C9374_012927 [Naegleria lovaniensis]|uniref:Protein YIPF n=1 Tax=Naegleria lovaniensis TaxID=51637 RepID=A0AA88GC02_NAELO|nr:uncharacterized protein C9374_012927 [Naegleria lovaniensis]KAG2372984.1 hypothetical protein C9374_012927 [Naegleria lovaniensis]
MNNQPLLPYEGVTNSGANTTSLDFQDFGTQNLSSQQQLSTEPIGRMNLDEHNNLFDVQLPQATTTTTSTIPSAGNVPTNSNNSIILSGEDDEEDDLQNIDFSQYSFWNIEYYIPFFNVNTTEVLLRMSKPFLFFASGGESFVAFVKRGKKQADLWGPFWIVTTLIVVIIMTSNIGQFINLRAIGGALENDFNAPVRANSSSDSEQPFRKLNGNLLEWTTDFSLVSVGATVFYAFSLLVPTLLWMMMKYKAIGVSLVETLCIYGYSFVVVIPPLVLCVFDISWLRWILIVLGFTYAAAFIVYGLFKEWKKGVTGPQDNIFLLIFIIFVLACHFILAIFVRFYFFTFHVDLKQQ